MNQDNYHQFLCNGVLGRTYSYEDEEGQKVEKRLCYIKNTSACPTKSSFRVGDFDTSSLENGATVQVGFHICEDGKPQIDTIEQRLSNSLWDIFLIERGVVIKNNFTKGYWTIVTESEQIVVANMAEFPLPLKIGDWVKLAVATYRKDGQNRLCIAEMVQTDEMPSSNIFKQINNGLVTQDYFGLRVNHDIIVTNEMQQKYPQLKHLTRIKGTAGLSYNNHRKGFSWILLTVEDIAIDWNERHKESAAKRKANKPNWVDKMTWCM